MRKPTPGMLPHICLNNDGTPVRWEDLPLDMQYLTTLSRVGQLANEARLILRDLRIGIVDMPVLIGGDMDDFEVAAQKAFDSIMSHILNTLATITEEEVDDETEHEANA